MARLLFYNYYFHTTGIPVPFGVMVHALAHDGGDAVGVDTLLHQVFLHLLHALFGHAQVVGFLAGLRGIAIQGHGSVGVLFQDTCHLVQLGRFRAQLDAVVGEVNVLKGAVVVLGGLLGGFSFGLFLGSLLLGGLLRSFTGGFFLGGLLGGFTGSLVAGGLLGG